jgi:hypothetical protein
VVYFVEKENDVKRIISLAVMLLAFVMTAGCGGSAEVTPDESLVPTVDQAEIDAEIRRGMEIGGATDTGETFLGSGGDTGGGDTGGDATDGGGN